MGSYSDSEKEVFYPYYCPPPPLGKMVRPAGLARMRFSSGSLQLDEEEEGEEEEEGGEDGAAKGKAEKETKSEEEEKEKAGGDEKKGASKITEVTL